MDGQLNESAHHLLGTNQDLTRLLKKHILTKNYSLMHTLLAQIADAAPSTTGIDGFLATRASLMMDVVVTAMGLVILLLGISIYLVKYRAAYLLHKQLQLGLAALLLVTVAVFEIDVQYLSVWEPRAEPSPYFEAANPWLCVAGLSLIVHLCFSVPTFLLWVYIVTQALRNFSKPPQPSAHSRSHALWGKLGSIGMLMTTVTGWIFYWLAFVA